MPQRELERLQAVHRFLNLKINKDAELQEIVELAAELCETPIALITLIDERTQFFLYKTGTDISSNIRKDSFCNYLLNSGEMVIIPDTLADPRFANVPSVVNAPKIRFYAGAPLATHDGHILGSICILDVVPKELSKAQIHLLKVLAKRVIQFMEFEFSVDILKKQFLQAKDAEIKLRSFFESSVACHLLLGKEQEILAFNKNMFLFLENMYQVEVTTGMPASEILKGEALERFVHEYQKALHGSTLQHERKVSYPNGTVIWWDVTFEPAYNDEGEIIGVSYDVSDITKRKLYEEQIISQNESLKKIAYIQSHDLRKHVASILGLINVFKSNYYKTSKKEILMLEQVALEMDNQVRAIVKLSEAQLFV
jgi:PAS domain S-box-containing protein